jgi:hypothetical protein
MDKSYQQSFERSASSTNSTSSIQNQGVQNYTSDFDIGKASAESMSGAGNIPKQSAQETTGGFLSSYFTLNVKKVPLTLIYCVAFWNFGICVAIFGPTLLDLACQTSSTLSTMSFLYFMQNLASLFGCFVSGLLIKKNK